VRLRYARVLFEETENDLEAETALSKGVCLCFLHGTVCITDGCPLDRLV